MHRGKERTDMSMKAHLGTRVPSGTGDGRLEEKTEHRNQWKRLGSYDPGVILPVQLNVHSE